MRRYLSRTIYKTIGWRHNMTVDIPDKCVICVAPHTSNWDFILGKLFYTSIGKTASFLMKDSWFFFPVGQLLKSIGGVPVNRKQTDGLREQLAEEFKRRKCFQLAITPEGTRKLNPVWKKGFYHIASMAEVPIVLIYMDYGKKEIGTIGVFYPTGNEEMDIRQIKLQYKTIKACHPEKFSIG
jgi:1-acyl-sn-glycerol-3-phosphate acyltransferase